MKKNYFMGSLLVAGLSLSACQGVDPTLVKLANEVDTVSYGLGLNIGVDMARNIESFPGEKLNKDALIAGLIQSLNEDSTNYKLSIDEARSLLQEYIEKAAEEDKMKALLEADEYLTANKAKEGVIVTESGLQYKVIKEGDGQTPTANDIVKVHYTGKLIDGTVFDSSVERNQPAEFPVSAVIPGWTEALQLMKVGAKYELVIAPRLGYGERPAGPIPANSVLLFEVELLDIVKKGQAETGQKAQ